MLSYLRKIFGRLCPMLEDEAKTRAFAKSLTEKFGDEWEPIPESHAFTSVSGTWDALTFQPNRGIPLKLFFNKKTTEIKAFPLYQFKLDEKKP